MKPQAKPETKARLEVAVAYLQTPAQIAALSYQPHAHLAQERMAGCLMTYGPEGLFVSKEGAATTLIPSANIKSMVISD